MRIRKLIFLVIYFLPIFSGVHAQKGEPYAKIIPYYSKGKWGYCNKERVVVIPCIFDSTLPVSCYENDYGRIELDKSGDAFLNGRGYAVYPNGDIIDKWTARKYKIDNNFKLVLLPADEEPQDEYMEVTEKRSTEKKTDYVTDKGITYTVVDYMGFISRTNRGVILKTDSIYGLAVIDENHEFVSWVIPPEFNQLKHILYGVYFASNDTVGKVYDWAKVIIGPYEKMEYKLMDKLLFRENAVLYFAKKGNEYFFLNNKGEVLPWGSFEAMTPGNYNPMYIGVKRDGKWGLIDKYGKTILPFVYDSLEIKAMDCNLVKVKKGDKIGYVDMNGKEYF